MRRKAMSYNTKNKTFAITQENEKQLKELALAVGQTQNVLINAAITLLYEKMMETKDTTNQ